MVYYLFPLGFRRFFGVSWRLICHAVPTTAEAAAVAAAAAAPSVAAAAAAVAAAEV